HMQGRRAAPPAPERVQLEVTTVEKRVASPPPDLASAPARPSTARVRTARRMASAAKPAVPEQPMAEERAAPSPVAGTSLATAQEPAVVMSEIAFESTSAPGGVPVPVGSALSTSGGRVSRAVTSPRPAGRFASASELAEAPRVLNRRDVDIRRYYPKDALRQGKEGEVQLRLTIESDGSIAEAIVVRDPGDGMGAAALRAVREFRFAPGKVGASPVATEIPFVIRFVIS
ncbi:MAG TPA: TonB family protein, partial [Anaeromyxobacteraceae bacterium]|nr:TonB family protein [Anaeromyxobacteraceae bacterium]